jgi:transcriptional regulator with XRE-family HTH domain
MQTDLPEHIDLELLRTLRGKRSQAHFSQILGYRYNQVHLWEMGKRTLDWNDFVHLCSTLKRPLTSTILKLTALQDELAIAKILSHGFRSHKKNELAKNLGISTSKLSRWLSGKSVPSLQESFRMMSLAYLNFADFLDEIAGPGKLRSIQPKVEESRKLSDLMVRLPYIGAVAPALALRSYRALKQHKPGFVAEAAGITLAQEEEALRVLREFGQIELKNGIYQLRHYKVNVMNEKERFHAACQYWAERAAKQTKWLGQKSLFGYRVFGITEAGYQKLRQAQINYYNEITEILAQDKSPPDHVVTVNFHTFVAEKKP